MPDIPTSPSHAHAIRREDYRPPDWLVPEIALEFTLGVRVRPGSGATLGRAQRRRTSRPLRLDGDGLIRSA